ncbi:hypothetical protein [Acetobacter fallax]|uniref:Stability/partitioning determinant n=1 Tax=Acetobacter fallax TaxID=1737473 RepID=A0ABX0KC21_9PROT|nr:hypothetical protein [Acetobacter fallax]NHO33997.1 hypothetical protein [Acetobacter fallax]NHO37531.1 hypothetical protein [Acetobacter fallax]
MTEEPQRAKLDFSDFGREVQTQKRPAVDKATTAAAVDDARRAGFTARSDRVKVDGRSLRRTGRSAQLNIKVKPETRVAFFEMALDFHDTQEFVDHLLMLYARKRKNKSGD